MRATSPLTAEPGSLAAYWRFAHAVAQAQLLAWLPNAPGIFVDISGATTRAAELATGAGHTVLRLIAGKGPAAHDSAAVLSCMADGRADGVIAEDRTLSVTIAAETIVAEIGRVIRPGGRVLACVDSLVLGMAMLAEQHHWPQLADLPHAEVVLVPWPDGTITRCYGPEQLRELFSGAGLQVCWIRPRTILSVSTVSYLLGRDPASLSRLVAAELRAHSDDSAATQLVICARKPA